MARHVEIFACLWKSKNESENTTILMTVS
jgi:hypothetical protein